MTEREAYIALNMVQGIGAATLAKGVDAFGSAVSFFSAGAEKLAEMGRMSQASAEKLAHKCASVDWMSEIEHAEAKNVTLVTAIDDAYPELLKSIPSAPLVLYVTGSVAALNTLSVAMIGTRAPTTYGRANAKSFAHTLAKAGVTIVSGLARGIDTEAHKGALLAKGCTVAVIGSALDKLYPAENRTLARQIVAEGGAVISEYPFGRVADRQTFPMRNRIISGLSQAILVVEAGVASGTLITTDHALDQGRSVMAIPGRIENDTARGCHKLIKDGARLVESPKEVLDELHQLPSMGNMMREESTLFDTTPARPKPQLDDIETQILSLLTIEDMTPDALIAAIGLSPALVSPRLISLEMKCQIERIAGNVLHICNS